MRIPQWFVMVWVVVFGVTAVLASILTHHFVRDRAIELDNVLSLPRPARPLDLADYFVDLLNPPDAAPKTNELIMPTLTPEPAAPTPEPTQPPLATEAMSTAEALPAATVEVLPAVTAEVASVATPDPAVVQAAPPVWNDPRRVNILLLGIDQRAGEQGPFPTDTIILLSIDPAGQTAAMLTIPRDLWVDYPTGQTGRINAANIIGDQVQYPGGGGPAMAVKTVEQTIGVKIQFYVLINFEVFTALIDVIGPVEVCPNEPIDDDKYPDGSYGYITIHFDAGCQDLEAERLLQYARTRHGDSDISRSSRQQEVILAVREKVLTTGGIIKLLPQALNLWESLQANFATNMTFDDMMSLAQKAESIPEENIRQSQISIGEGRTGVTPEGDQILVPIPSDIALLLSDLFRPAGTPSSRPEAQ